MKKLRKKDSREKVKVADTYERVLKRNGKSGKSIKSRKLYSEKKRRYEKYTESDNTRTFISRTQKSKFQMSLVKLE